MSAVACLALALLALPSEASTVTATVTPSASSTVAADAPAAEGTGTRWYAVPNFAFDTDDGFGLGARAELAEDAPGHQPYRSAYMIHVFASSRGFHHHRVRWDRVGFGPENRLRFTAHLAWRAWLNDGYFGIGNRTLRERAFVGELEADDPARKRYNYSLQQPFAHLTLRARVAQRVELYGALNLKWSSIDPYPGSVLERDRPFGIDGGLGAQVLAGVFYDSRRPEIDPRSGVVLELGVRGQPPLPGGAGYFAGVLASARGFYSPGSRVVLAGRLMGEYLLGKVPFFEMVHWGGAAPIAGFGGADTLRGIRFGRFRAPGKAVLNAEARLDVLRHAAGGKPLVWQLVPYVDAGVVFGEGTLATGPAGGWPVHPGAGFGARAVYAGAFVGRLDMGWGLDPVLEPDGRVTAATTYRFYLVFDHTF
jgi:hypothetical protein